MKERSLAAERAVQRVRYDDPWSCDNGDRDLRSIVCTADD